MVTQQASLMPVLKEMPDASPSKRRYTLPFNLDLSLDAK